MTKKRSYKRGNKTALKISSGHQAKPTATGLVHDLSGGDLLASVPRAPQTLTTSKQRAIWRATCGALHQRGQLSAVDLTLVEAYCWACTTYYDARRELDKTSHLVDNDKGNKVVNPLRRVVRAELSTMTGLAKELGLTPRARQQVAALIEKVKSLRMANAVDVESEPHEHIGNF